MQWLSISTPTVWPDLARKVNDPTQNSVECVNTRGDSRLGQELLNPGSSSDSHFCFQPCASPL